LRKVLPYKKLNKPRNNPRLNNFLNWGASFCNSKISTLSSITFSLFIVECRTQRKAKQIYKQNTNRKQLSKLRSSLKLQITIVGPNPSNHRRKTLQLYSNQSKKINTHYQYQNATFLSSIQKPKIPNHTSSNPRKGNKELVRSNSKP
jgi:hypothetical protein